MEIVDIMFMAIVTAPLYELGHYSWAMLYHNLCHWIEDFKHSHGYSVYGSAGKKEKPMLGMYVNPIQGELLFITE